VLISTKSVVGTQMHCQESHLQDSPDIQEFSYEPECKMDVEPDDPTWTPECQQDNSTATSQSKQKPEEMEEIYKQLR